MSGSLLWWISQRQLWYLWTFLSSLLSCASLSSYWGPATQEMWGQNFLHVKCLQYCYLLWEAGCEKHSLYLLTSGLSGSRFLQRSFVGCGSNLEHGGNLQLQRYLNQALQSLSVAYSKPSKFPQWCLLHSRLELRLLYCVCLCLSMSRCDYFAFWS